MKSRLYLYSAPRNAYVLNDVRSFSIYQLRAGYLQHIKDGVGERLITLNTTVLNNPAFRAAGWAPNPADSKRTYSPPIPTAITSDYFQVPPRSAGLPFGEDEDEHGMVTGQGSHDTVGPTMDKRRRKRKEQLEEEDSSDLSDESEEEAEESKRAAQQIKFNKMPVRVRSGSSPLRPSKLKDEVKEDDFSLLITSPSRPAEQQTLRRGSMGAVDAIKQRARRDTATSSEWSSENELEPLAFRKQKVQPWTIKSNQLLPDIIQEEELKAAESDLDDSEVSDASDLSDEFRESGLLGLGGAPLTTVDTLESPPPSEPQHIPPAITASPRKTRQQSIPSPPALPRLPSGRPVSFMQPVSLLSKAFKTSTGGENPFQQFTGLSGKADPNPLWIKIYAPFSANSSTPFEVPLRRTAKEGIQVTVAELIGLSLWRYGEEKYEPPIQDQDKNINRWTLRMVEDEEVDYDFPALGRSRPVVDFTSNNNRPSRGRTRDKPWDEFALVRASDDQYRVAEELTPQFSGPTPASATQPVVPTPEPSRTQTPIPMQRTGSDNPAFASFVPNHNPITGPSFALSAVRKDSTAPLLDAPAVTAPSSTPRTGVPKTVTIHYVDTTSFQATVLPIPTTTDTYIAELFTTACQRLKLDKALHVLKVRGTQTVAPQDRTVEALGERLQLDLIRRRFVGVGDEGAGTSGSPGSESPNAPLLLTTGTTPTKAKKKGFAMLTGRTAGYENNPSAPYSLGPGGKRYHVMRRQPLSFASSHPRILAFDGEYLHIMSAASVDPDTGAGVAGSGKTTSVHMSSVVGCKVSRKHPKMIRMLVYREKEETKRYDFEANNKEEAIEIAADVRRGVERFGIGDT